MKQREEVVLALLQQVKLGEEVDDGTKIDLIFLLGMEHHADFTLNFLQVGGLADFVDAQKQTVVDDVVLLEEDRVLFEDVEEVLLVRGSEPECDLVFQEVQVLLGDGVVVADGFSVIQRAFDVVANVDVQRSVEGVVHDDEVNGLVDGLGLHFGEDYFVQSKHLHDHRVGIGFEILVVVFEYPPHEFVFLLLDRFEHEFPVAGEEKKRPRLSRGDLLIEALKLSLDQIHHQVVCAQRLDIVGLVYLVELSDFLEDVGGIVDEETFLERPLFVGFAVQVHVFGVGQV